MRPMFGERIEPRSRELGSRVYYRRSREKERDEEGGDKWILFDLWDNIPLGCAVIGTEGLTVYR